MITSAVVIFHTKEIYSDRTIEIPCHRHGDAFYIISQLLDAEELDKTRTEQGFLNDEGKFLDRYRAMDEAIACGQLPITYCDAEPRELYSEDLW